MVTTTAPVACRATFPVSRVTVSLPYWNVLLTILNIYFSCSCETRATLQTLTSIQESLSYSRHPTDVVSLAAQAQTLDQRCIAIHILALEVVKQLAAAIYHANQTTT